MILGLLPAFCFVFVALAFRRRGLCWRESILSAALVLGVLLTAGTELLGAFKKINSVALLALWAAAALASVLVYSYSADKSPPAVLAALPRDVKWMVAGVGVLLVLTAVVAAASAPNNWDSLTYRLSRVMHWMQAQSVAHYPTHIVRQIELNPWAEFAVLHLYVLSRGDSLVNFVQWCAMAGSVAGVSLIARELKADARGQAYAAVAAATIPMGILQATSTQNDTVLALWLVCFVYFGLLLRQQHTWLRAAALGASLGLAILTKATAYLYALPFLVWFFVACLRADRRRTLWSVPLVACAVLAINAGHYARNYQLFGSPLDSGSLPYANEVFGPATLLSNLTRNVALHVTVRSNRVNQAMDSGLRKTFAALGADIDDPRTTFPGTTFKIAREARHEDLAGNPFHLLLILLALVVIAARKQARTEGALPYVLALCAGFTLFALYLRWQPWHTRLHLSLFVLWSPVIAVALSALPRRWLAGAAVWALFAFSLPYVLASKNRPLVGKDSVLLKSRLDQYFYNYPELKDSYHRSAQLVAARRCGDVALQIGSNSWEYPIWVLLENMSERRPRIAHVEVRNASARLAPAGFVPCAILRTDNDERLHVSFPSNPQER